MTKIPALHPTIRAWLLEGPLAAHIPAYVARLTRGDYATRTSVQCLSSVAHFSHWMSMCRLPVRLLDDDCIERFIRDTCLVAIALAVPCAQCVEYMRRSCPCWQFCARTMSLRRYQHQ